MNIFGNSLYDWNYTGIGNPDENENNDKNADDKNLIRASSNCNKCDDIIVLDYISCCCSRFIGRI